jgi:hypothetical protein
MAARRLPPAGRDPRPSRRADAELVKRNMAALASCAILTNGFLHGLPSVERTSRPCMSGSLVASVSTAVRQVAQFWH